MGSLRRTEEKRGVRVDADQDDQNVKHLARDRAGCEEVADVAEVVVEAAGPRVVPAGELRNRVGQRAVPIAEHVRREVINDS